MVDATAPPSQPLFMASTEEARAAMLAAAGPLGARFVTLDHRGGPLVLAKAIAARQDLPPFNASAMDGYAARRADHFGAPLRLVGESAAGQSFPRALQPGEAVRIFTGAAVPEGADIVVIQEEATADGALVRLAPEKPDKDNIRPKGVDLKAGDAVLPPGRRLDPAALGLAAAAGQFDLVASRPPRVGLMCTGTELVKPGANPLPDQIFESNSYALSALIEAWSGRANALAALADNAAAIAQAATDALGHMDVLVVVGGASVGDHDLVKPALETLGLSLIFNKIKMRPGKPTWFGRIEDTLVLGLPGNPASAFVCAHLFLKPLMAKLSGADPGPIAPLRAKLAAPLKAEGPREGFLRARLWVGDNATVWADAALDQDSSLTRVLAQANGCIRRPASVPAAKAGDLVEAFVFEGRTLWES